MAEIDFFPLWVRLTHLFNFFFMSLLVRSGLEIIATHPKLYWNDDALPGTEWVRFTRKRLPEHGIWTAEDEIQPFPSWLALPGEDNLGLGRHWHFWSLTGWVLTGLTYVVCMFATPLWLKLVPTSWQILPESWHTFVTYIQLNLPPEGHPFNPLQQLTYFLIIFFLSPLQILTGILQSPALIDRFPWLVNIFGGRQVVRSIHFIGFVLFFLFFLIHISMIIWHGLGGELAIIVLGGQHHSHTLAIVIAAAAIVAVILFHIIGTKFSLRRPKIAKTLLQIGINPLKNLLFHHWTSRQNYTHISPYARINGRPPRNENYRHLAANGFKDYRLEVTGLVEKQLSLSLEDLRALPRMKYRSRHNCIQGWTYLAEWCGVPVSVIVEQCRPLPEAHYLVFHTMDEKWENQEGGLYQVAYNGFYYEVIDLEIARKHQTVLAYEMNGAPLPIEHGAPVRLRAESQLGYKMAKFVKTVEFVRDYRQIGEGQGGWRDDVLNYFPLDGSI